MCFCVIRFNSLGIRWIYLCFSFWDSGYKVCTYTLGIQFFFLNWNKLRKCRAGVRIIPIFSVSFVVFIHQQNKDNHIPTRLKQDIDYPLLEFWKVSNSHGNLSRPLEDTKNVILPPLHIKLGTFKNFVKLIVRNGNAFGYLKSEKLKSRVRIFQDILETDNSNSNFFQIIILPGKTNKSTYCLFKKSKYVLNYRALKFQYNFSTFSQFVKNISKTVTDIVKVRQYSRTALKSTTK